MSDLIWVTEEKTGASFPLPANSPCKTSSGYKTLVDIREELPFEVFQAIDVIGISNKFYNSYKWTTVRLSKPGPKVNFNLTIEFAPGIEPFPDLIAKEVVLVAKDKLGQEFQEVRNVTCYPAVS